MTSAAASLGFLGLNSLANLRDHARLLVLILQEEVHLLPELLDHSLLVLYEFVFVPQELLGADLFFFLSCLFLFKYMELSPHLLDLYFVAVPFILKFEDLPFHELLGLEMLQTHALVRLFELVILLPRRLEGLLLLAVLGVEFLEYVRHFLQLVIQHFLRAFIFQFLFEFSLHSYELVLD